jgi:hypothetical protein
MLPSEIDSLPEYTDVQLLKLYRYALARGWAGTEHEIADQRFKFPEPAALLKLIEQLEERVAKSDAADADTDGGPLGTALASFN